MVQLPAGREASQEGGAVEYERHRPERTLLYQLVEEYYPAFKVQWAAEGKELPDYVQREFEDFLKCGCLEHGFYRVRCESCHEERLLGLQTAGFLPQLRCAAHGGELCPAGGGRLSFTAGAPVGAELSVSIAFSVRQPAGGHGPGARNCLPCHCHAPDQEGGFARRTAHTGAVTPIQRFGGALNLNVHLHMLFLDGVYVEGRDGSLGRFQWVKAPTSDELTRLSHTIVRRVGRYLERQGLVESDAENSYLAGDASDDESMAHLQGHSITYRIAVGPHRGRKVFTLQTLPAWPP